MAKGTTKRVAEAADQTPTLETSPNFSVFMQNMMAHQVKSRLVMRTDSRSDVLQSCNDVLGTISVCVAEAVMHVATIANTAPEVFESRDQKVTPQNQRSNTRER